MLNLDSEFQKLCKILEKEQEIVILALGGNASFHFREIKTICEFFYEQEISEKRIKASSPEFVGEIRFREFAKLVI